MNILIFILFGAVTLFAYESYKENEIMNAPKIYHHGTMIDIDTDPLSLNELDELTDRMFSWQPDITNSRLRMYGSEAMMWAITSEIKEKHPEYNIITVV